MMVGTGVGILVKGILPKAKGNFLEGMFSKDRIGDSIIAMRWAPIAMVLSLLQFWTTACKMGVVETTLHYDFKCLVCYLHVSPVRRAVRCEPDGNFRHYAFFLQQRLLPLSDRQRLSLLLQL